MGLKLRCEEFEDGGEIPPHLTCDGANAAPALHWSDLPPGTRTLALVVDDPDAPDPAAPKRTWVHWVVFNIPAKSEGLPEGGQLPRGAREGRNDSNRAGYSGPCPPIGRHRYYFKLYALDTELQRLRQPTKGELEEAMQGHILDHTEMVGLYQRE